MVEDVSRVAFAEGSFGAGRLNEQICSKFSRNSSVTGKRCVHDRRVASVAHNEGGTALTRPSHSQCEGRFLCSAGFLY